VAVLLLRLLSRLILWNHIQFRLGLEVTILMAHHHSLHQLLAQAVVEEETKEAVAITAVLLVETVLQVAQAQIITLSLVKELLVVAVVREIFMSLVVVEEVLAQLVHLGTLDLTVVELSQTTLLEQLFQGVLVGLDAMLPLLVAQILEQAVVEPIQIV
jgi:hypothetical protein